MDSRIPLGYLIRLVLIATSTAALAVANFGIRVATTAAPNAHSLPLLLGVVGSVLALSTVVGLKGHLG